MLVEDALILANDALKCELYRMELRAPLVSAKYLPGQFVHLQLLGLEAHILRRPLSVYRCDISQGTIVLLYQVVGEGTRHLATLERGATVNLIGPLGHGWHAGDAKRALLVGGGVGAAPLYMLAHELRANGAELEVALGASTCDALTTAKDFETLLGSEHIHFATDDGSVGHAGFVTELVAQLLANGDFDYVALCGPEVMQRKVASMVAQTGGALHCEVSLERRMACGIGACLGCTINTINGRKRACADGPVFAAEEVVW